MTDEPSHVRWSTMSLVPGPLDSPPPSVNAEVEFGAQSRRDWRRSTNQDHYLILRWSGDRKRSDEPAHMPNVPDASPSAGYGMVLADGTAATAKLASRLAMTTLSHLIVSFGKWNLRINEEIADEVVDRAERFYRNIDLALSRAGRQNPQGLRTTLTAVYHRRQRTVLCSRGTFARLSVSRWPTDAADARLSRSPPEASESGAVTTWPLTRGRCTTP